MTAKNPEPIGMFDSGIGGLTVMRQLMTTLPNESVIYFGDTARLPYGDKSSETIIRYALENAIFLLEKNVKLLIVACNTASAYAIEQLQHNFTIPILGVIEPGAEKASQITRNGRIAVLGTKATIRSQAYQRAITQRLPEAMVLPIACPLFVPLVEEQFFQHQAARMIVKEYLQPLKNHSVDTLLLGCTHYPLLKDLIQDEVGNGVAIIDSATTCAEKVNSILASLELKNESLDLPSYKYFVSDDPEKFKQSGEAFLGTSIETIELMHSSFQLVQ